MSPSAAPTARDLPRWLGPVLLGALAAAMLAWTWGQWADVLVDFGGELYVAWRLREGDVLYRDLAYFTGPLSPYVNALWFRAFGTSAMTLVIANLALLAITTTLLYRLAVALADHLAATAACALFLVLCALAVHQGAGNYNFVCPYSHEMTHATLLSLASLTALRRWSARPSFVAAAASGLCFGCVCLTKVEFTVALGAALAIAVLTTRQAFAVRARALCIVAAAALFPIGIAFALLSRAMPASDALRGALGAWNYVSDERVSGFPLYRVAMGMFPFSVHASRLLIWGALASTFVALAYWAALRPSTALRGVLIALLALAAWFANAVDAFYPLTFYVLAIAVLLWRARRTDEATPLKLALAVFALLLLGRMALNARVQFYGFALAAPAIVLVALALFGWLPARIAQANGRAREFQVWVGAAFALVVIGHLIPMQRGLATRTLAVGRGGDKFSADPRGEFLAQALELIEKRTRPDQSVLVLPEGAMLDYLARRRAPSRYFNFMPPELAMFGESAVLASLNAAPPELVVLIHRETLEYGLPFFGRDYGRELMAWVKRDYEPIKLWSAVPGQKPLEPGTAFAVAVLQRRR